MTNFIHSNKEAFQDLFSIARIKDAFVGDHLELFSDPYQWNVSFIKASHNWEVNVTLFFNLLYSTRLRLESKDKLYWALPSESCPT
jgi:hypothetical protein